MGLRAFIFNSVLTFVDGLYAIVRVSVILIICGTFAHAMFWIVFGIFLIIVDYRVLIGVEVVLGIIILWSCPWEQWFLPKPQGQQPEVHRRGRRVHDSKSAEEKAYQELLRRRSDKRIPRSRPS